MLTELNTSVFLLFNTKSVSSRNNALLQHTPLFCHVLVGKKRMIFFIWYYSAKKVTHLTGERHISDASDIRFFRISDARNVASDFIFSAYQTQDCVWFYFFPHIRRACYYFSHSFFDYIFKSTVLTAWHRLLEIESRLLRHLRHLMNFIFEIEPLILKTVAPNPKLRHLSCP